MGSQNHISVENVWSSPISIIFIHLNCYLYFYGQLLLKSKSIKIGKIIILSLFKSDTYQTNKIFVPVKLKILNKFKSLTNFTTFQTGVE